VGHEATDATIDEGACRAILIAAALLSRLAHLHLFGGLPNLSQFFSGPTPAPTTGDTAPDPTPSGRAASGHPLMTHPIREAAANFDNCVASMWPIAAAYIAKLSAFTAGLRHLRILICGFAAEFSKSIWDSSTSW